MKTSMNLLLWTTYVTADHFPVLGNLRRTGFDGVEVAVFEGDAAHFKSLRAELDKQGFKCTTVTVATPEANPISPDASIRKAAVERLKRAIDMTAILGGEILCGPYHSPLAVFSGTGPTPDEKKRAVDDLRQAAEIAEKANVKLAIRSLIGFE